MRCTSSCKTFHIAGGYLHYYQSKYSEGCYDVPTTGCSFVCVLYMITRVRGLRVFGQCSVYCEWTWPLGCLPDGVGSEPEAWYPAPSAYSLFWHIGPACFRRLPFFSLGSLKSGFLDSLSSPTLVIRSGTPLPCVFHLTQGEFKASPCDWLIKSPGCIKVRY